MAAVATCPRLMCPVVRYWLVASPVPPAMAPVAAAPRPTSAPMPAVAPATAPTRAPVAAHRRVEAVCGHIMAPYTAPPAAPPAAAQPTLPTPAVSASQPRKTAPPTIMEAAVALMVGRL